MHSSTPHRTPAPVIPAQRMPSATYRPAMQPVIPAPRRPVDSYRPAMSAPAIPAQRRPTDSHRPATPASVVPTPRQPVDTTGRHRRNASRITAALDAVGQLGSAVSLSALLVVAAAVGGLADGQPTDDAAPISITFDTAP